MTTPSPGTVNNYTLGAHQLLLGGSTVGYVVTASVSTTLSFLSKFSAWEGKDVEDPTAPDSLSMSIDVSMEEVCESNLRAFFLAGDTGIVGARPVYQTPITFKGVAVVGNNFDWAIPSAIIVPGGNLSYQDQDWTNFPIKAIIRPNRSVQNPWGTITTSTL